MNNETGKNEVSGALFRFRVMAFVSGVMSLLLWFIDMPVTIFGDESWHNKVVWIPMVHGYTYPFYVFTALHLSVKARYSLKKMVSFILAGTLPVASFIAERKAVKEHS